MFNYERSVAYPEGHRNVIFAQRGVRVLPRLPITSGRAGGTRPTPQMLYAYLKKFNGIVALPHQRHEHGHRLARQRSRQPNRWSKSTRATGRTTKCPDAPRTNSEKDSIGGWRPKGFVNLALEKGYKLAFEASSDHISTHMSYCQRPGEGR